MTVRKSIESYVVSGDGRPVRRPKPLSILLRASVLRRGSYAHGNRNPSTPGFQVPPAPGFFIALRTTVEVGFDVVTLRGAHVPSREVHRTYAGLAADGGFGVPPVSS